VPVGSVLSIEHVVRVEPYFPSGRVVLAEQDRIESLSVEVTGAGDGWRWQIEGSLADPAVEEADGSFVLRIEDLPDVETLADEAADGKAPILRYAWGARESWRDVGGWYEELLDDVPRRPEAVRALARQLTAGVEDPRRRLEALLGFVRGDVRYVAVQVGVGGWRPSPPGAVLERRWGDCKDKALLFVDMLDEAGIPGYPVLIRLSSGDDVDPDFPFPFGFNHVIVAVPADAVAAGDGDPVAGGLLFIDPTQEKGSAAWLHPYVQGKNALVVRGDRSGLVETPNRFLDESERLTVELAISAAGDASGRAEVLLRGNWAAAAVEELRSPRAEQFFLGFLSRRLPGFDLGERAWQEEPGEAPGVRMAVAVRAPGFASGGGSGPSLHLPGLAATPSSRDLADETMATLRAGSRQTLWRLDLPPGWCPPEAAETGVANSVGSFSQTISSSGRRIEIERRVDVDTQRVEGEAASDLEELSRAEHRTLKRRLRFGCGGG
jgi:transglutaminase-like putative cysteine protease